MEIQEIKQRLTLAMLLQHYGLKADKQNRLKCPFHNDKTPSLQLYYKTQTAYCFSTNCNTHGKAIDVIDFIMYYEKCSKHEAIKKAESIINPTTQAPPISKQANEKAMFLERMFTYFKNAVHNSKPAREYIESRNLDHKQLEIGYNAGQFHHGARKDESLINDCLKYGILLDLGLKSRTGETAYKPFGKWCIVFALRNPNHEITGLYFRSTLSDKEQRHFYLRDRSGLYPSYPKADTQKLILTESIIDAASLLQQEEIKSKYEIVSLYGTNGLTEEHQTAIRKLKHLTEIIFFLNGDEPGNKAVAKYGPMLKAEYPNLKITSAAVPENEDVNSLLQGHSPEILTHLIETRKEVDFILSSEESPKGTEITQLLSDEKEKSEQPKAPINGLDTTNPYNLKYKGNEAAYQIKGFRTDQPDSLKITIQTIAEASSITLKLDLYEYKQVESSCKLIAGKLGLRKDAIEADLMQLTSLLEQYRDKQQFKANGRQESKIQVPAATATKCIGFLKAEKLVQRINKLIGKAGITGEETNRILLFVIASSYKMPDTLHALIQGSSGSGKTRLLKIISYLMPDEDVKRYTRVTDNSFYNQDEYFFVNKLICFEDLDGLKEDAQLAVRELQSNDILRTSTSIKDASGKISGGERTVRGPIASLACTTKGEIYEDNISRSFLIAVDESKEQTLRVIHYQNHLAAGLVDKEEQKRVTTFVQNCIRLLKPYEVINPYANKIQLPESAHKIRRLNELYQSFVKQITLLNQYQRKQDKQGRLITETEDLQTACEILFESIVLKVDELDGSLRQFFERLKSHLKDKEQEFTQREIRQMLNISKAQCSRFFNHLQEMEYITAKYSGNQRKVCYKVDYWDNYAKVRTQIKDDLMNQIAGL
ncbi:MAG: DNA primase [Algoriphagus sp.]|jgi:DNA primase/Trp operon repressor|uniref:CHC2 zinc finger domain-containing protein n=1 Tax=unclassified Algoriphagus TaxID=2641541 RepID=UPI000C41489C|nr:MULTISPECIES: CHC2 zinc finger domain-containing protein [unclassified Algoriphagus]MAL12733.1 DNA primase [Algoriphagus sp.]MAL14954.1 DNA primase [Algoriphagus sp.]MAL15664.1 DNA primase [Algoriphagus sp.]|tara:strand:- start:4777 stop:7416 length:2640 start_codon:yes stop_codon:yes gene_type:complete